MSEQNTLNKAMGVADAPEDPTGSNRKWYDSASFRLLTDPAELNNIMARLKSSGAPAVAFDTETTGLFWKNHHIVGYSFSWEPDIGFYVPFRHTVGQNMPEEEALVYLEEMVTDYHLYIYNASFETHFIYNEGFNIKSFEDIYVKIWMNYPDDKDKWLRARVCR